jgi:hypothetical protein
MKEDSNLFRGRSLNGANYAYGRPCGSIGLKRYRTHSRQQQQQQPLFVEFGAPIGFWKTIPVMRLYLNSAFQELK